MIKFKLLPLLAAGCLMAGGSAFANETLTVGATPVPHAEILESVKDDLSKEGVDLKIKEFSDYIQPDTQLAEKQLDANYYQTIPFLDDYNKQHKTHLVSAGAIHIEPFGLYSKKIKDVKDLKDGSLIALPNDPANHARALLLLESNDLIKLKKEGDNLPTVADVTDNPKNLKFKEVEAAMLPRVLDDVDAALINTNYALQGGLNPLKDSLLIEGKDAPYGNVIAVREGDENDPRIQKLLKALKSEKVKKFIEDKYEGAVIPAF